MALKMVKGSIDRMFDKNLQDLVRGIRNHKEDEVRRRDPSPRSGPGVSLLPAGTVSGKGVLVWEEGSGSQNEEGDAGVWGRRDRLEESTRVNKRGSCLVLAFPLSVLLWC